MRWVSPVAVASLVAVLLSGCSGQGASTPPPDLPAEDLEVTAETGILHGVVVDPAYKPIENVVVVAILPDGNGTTLETLTGPDGAYGWDGLVPGIYIVEASKAGFKKARSTAEVIAGVETPDAVTLALQTDAATRPYHLFIQYDGYIECTTSVVVLCGAPNLLEPLACDFGACYGNLTGDRYTPTLFYDANVTYLQAELSWQSTQTASPELHMQVETGDDLDLMGDVSGPSPLSIAFNETQLSGWGIGGEVGVYYSIFSGNAVPGSPAPVGATAQQKIQIFTTAFYRYLPPEGWTFVGTGEVPLPP